MLGRLDSRSPICAVGMARCLASCLSPTYRAPDASRRLLPINGDIKLNNRNALHCFLFCLLFLGGCVAKKNESLSFDEVFSERATKSIGIVVTKAKEPAFLTSGIDSLYSQLRVYFGSGELKKLIKDLPTESFSGLRADVANLLEEKGFVIKQFEADLDLNKLRDYDGSKSGEAEKDFSRYKSKGVDLLLVLDVSEVGIHQHYNGHSPAGFQNAIVRSEAFIVNLADNTIAWHTVVESSIEVEVKGDMLPDFASYKRAHGAAIEEIHYKLKKEFSKE